MIFDLQIRESRWHAPELACRMTIMSGDIASRLSAVSTRVSPLTTLEVAIAISVLLAVVALSYRQVCRAYPSGGGAYSVSKENLGALASLVAAAALLIDFDYPPWHTADDTLDKISAQSLAVVGDVVLGALPAIERQLSGAR